MSAGLMHYYQRSKAGLMNIDPKAMAQMTEDWLIVGATGAGLGLIAASIGGLDKEIAGFPVPIDGLLSVGLGIAGLGMHAPELRIASYAAGGSAATRTFEKFFRKALNVHGDFSANDIPFGYGYGAETPQLADSYGYGWGSDRLVSAAANL